MKQLVIVSEFAECVKRDCVCLLSKIYDRDVFLSLYCFLVGSVLGSCSMFSRSPLLLMAFLAVVAPSRNSFDTKCDDVNDNSATFCRKCGHVSIGNISAMTYPLLVRQHLTKKEFVMRVG